MKKETLLEKKVKIRQDKSGLLAGEVLNHLVAFREENMGDLTLSGLAKELGFKYASSAMRVEKDTFKLTLSRFFEMCDLYKLDPAKVIAEVQKKVDL